MLYQRWREVARSNADQLAIWDGSSGRRYTFHELAQASSVHPVSGSAVQFARGTGVEFILSVLAAWRDRKVLVPLERGQSEPLIENPPVGNIVHLKTTSATTGAPCLIAFTAEQLAADCDHVVASMSLNPALPNVGAISLAHSYGFSNLVLPLLLKGIPLLLSASPLPNGVQAAIQQSESVALPSVPALWRAWQDAGIVSGRIRIAISAGAPLPLALEQKVFDSTGVKIHNFYGASECGGITYDRTDAPRPDPALTGTVMEGVEIGLSDEGCVTVRSAAVGAGYWPEDERALADGVFLSGDLGEIVGGELYLRGRATDRINVAGRKLIPEEVERVLARHPAVQDCLVFGVPADSIRNEIVVACVVAGSEATSRALTEFLQARLPSWQVPREWWFLDSLETNERGKRSRVAWRERYLVERGCAP